MCAAAVGSTNTKNVHKFLCKEIIKHRDKLKVFVTRLNQSHNLEFYLQRKLWKIKIGWLLVSAKLNSIEKSNFNGFSLFENNLTLKTCYFISFLMNFLSKIESCWANLKSKRKSYKKDTTWHVVSFRTEAKLKAFLKLLREKVHFKDLPWILKESSWQETNRQDSCN